jgi:hypothetical protein
MSMQAPTRITIEVHAPGSGDGQPVVRVVPSGDGFTPQAAAASQSGFVTHQTLTGEPREETPGPAAYEPGPCRCLDDDDCAADHANE